MAKVMSIFVSWSGKRSKGTALLLRAWLPNVLQAAEVWMSDVDIEAGMRGINEIFAQLEKARFGVICLTPENLDAPWLMFEAGAISKQVTEKSRVCPYLLGMKPTDIKKPLGEFQGVSADREGTLRLVKSVNRSLDRAALIDEKLEKTFAVWWPELEADIAKLIAAGEEIPKDETKAITERELLNELLGSTREIMRFLDEQRQYDRSAAAIRDRMNIIESDAALKAEQNQRSLEMLRDFMSDGRFLETIRQVGVKTFPVAEMSERLNTLMKAAFDDISPDISLDGSQLLSRLKTMMAPQEKHPDFKTSDFQLIDGQKGDSSSATTDE